MGIMVQENGRLVACPAKRTRASEARRRDGGAVLLEGLLVISMFVLMFIGLGYVQSVYLAQLCLIRSSRAVSIGFAQQACSGDPTAQLASSDAQTMSPVNQSPSDGSLVPNGKGGGDSTANSAVGEATKRSGLTLPEETTATAATGVIGPLDDPSQTGGSFYTDLTTSNHVLCGDQNRLSGPLGMFELAFQFLKMQ